MASIFDKIWVGLAVTHLDKDIWISSKRETGYFNSKGFIGSLTPTDTLAGEEVFIHLPSNNYFGSRDKFCHPTPKQIFERICQIIVDRLMDS
jgi:hypothetical protein